MKKTSSNNKTVRRVILWFLIILLIPAFSIKACSKSIRIKEIEITDPDIPKEFDGVKIIFFSDVHCGKFFSVEQVRKLVDKVNSRNPDIIILGGDYVGDYHPRRGFRRVLREVIILPIYGDPDAKDFVKPFFDEAKKLKAPLGVYAVLGNHDYWHDCEELSKESLSESGIKSLDNKAYWIKKGDSQIKLGGVTDTWAKKDQTLDPTINDAETGDFTILVSHNPSFAERIQTDKIDLMLSGHNHRAQFGLEPLFRKKENQDRYFYGLVEDPNLLVYITSGIGEVVLPIRIFAPPEIVEITLRKEK
ncbi:MAG: metallophosphoesterase [bacterium]|nr:metallophosphoesterase [bacterium]